ncbi:Uncharacterised protein [Segatella copri]|nr:Uncharacterised protein [Segatella copri]
MPNGSIPFTNPEKMKVIAISSRPILTAIFVNM